MANNPFLALFGPSGSVETPTTLKPEPQHSDFTNTIEDIFRFTLRSESSLKDGKLFYLSDLADALHPQSWFDQPTFEQALFDYCMLLEDNSVHSYLFQCYERSKKDIFKTTDNIKIISQAIFRNFQLSLLQSELFPQQDVHEQFLSLLSEEAGNDSIQPFLNELIRDCQESEDQPNPDALFLPTLGKLKEKFQKQHLLLVDYSCLEAVQVLSSNPFTAKLLVSSSILPAHTLGRECEKTILGSILSISCIPSSPVGPFDFFDRPSQTPQSVHAATEGNCWTALEKLLSKMHKIIYSLLKVSPEVNGLTRQWMGQLLHLNKARGQTWAQHHASVLKGNCATDGFMLNFEAILLKLCAPFCAPGDAKALERLAKIDPTFCAATADQISDTNGIHMDELYKETCLLTASEDEKRPCNAPFSFLTEVFYLAHRALELGSKVVHSQMVQMSQDLNRMQRAYQDAQSQQREVAEEIQRTMDRLMTTYLSCKAALLVPEVIQLRLQFTIATSRWLCSVALRIPPCGTSLLKFPLPEERNLLLACIPEFCISSVVDFVIFLSRFAPATLEEAGDNLVHYLTLIIVFMGSPHRLKNPHHRAAMAEMLDALVPHENQQHGAGLADRGTFFRQKLFRKHPNTKEVVATLLHVFASIEMTGQGVAFEQKFNYRRPMYAVMKFLWNLKGHCEHFKALAIEAEDNMEATQPPLFLQFCNLLINDAIYLLDEGLSYMSKLREQQSERTDLGTWPDVPPAQRSQREATYQHMGLLARFHNMMGKETIRILEMMTREIKSVLVHSTMVDRIAAMLNYFLLHLVGPKKRDFKVKDFKEKYEFDPAELVSSICQIYCNLGSVDAFCIAVSQDGRSYSPELFTLAESVLSRIGKGALIGDLQIVAKRVSELGATKAFEEDLIAIAPEEFLDPIMSTIMLNPVILPKSKVIVDRSTIARHLLSDQTDPFNRSPLTMDEVQPDENLKQRIQNWLEEQKKK